MHWFLNFIHNFQKAGGVVDFTNPAAFEWFKNIPQALLLILLPLVVLFVGIKGFVKNVISKKHAIKKQALWKYSNGNFGTYSLI